MQNKTTHNNRIDELFARKNEGVLSVYMTAGYPEIEDTVPLLVALQENGADMVEIGMPFSDPLADGKVIQESSQRALKNGMSLKILFSQLKGIREKVSIPLVLMGYLNPVLQFGLEAFLEACSKSGIDGVILPDLPALEYEQHFQSLFSHYGIHLILLVTPQTSDDRVKDLASLSGGFLYMVAASSTTGKTAVFTEEQLSYFSRISDLNLHIPRMIGFGISDRQGFDTASRYAGGAIIGSAYIKALGEGKDPVVSTASFLKGILGK